MSIELVQQRLDLVRQKLEEVQDTINGAMAEFTQVIKDKSIPLGDRWDLFVGAPEGLRGSHSYIWHPRALARLGRGGHEWEPLIWTERYMTVDLTELFDDFIDFHDDSDPGSFYTDDETTKITRDVLIALAEEILENNYGSFEFDW